MNGAPECSEYFVALSKQPRDRHLLQITLRMSRKSGRRFSDQDMR